jgi:hypothetical protein
MKAMQIEPSFFSGFYASKDLSMPPEPGIAARPQPANLIPEIGRPPVSSPSVLALPQLRQPPLPSTKHQDGSIP